MDYKQAYEKFTAGAETKPLYFVNKLQWGYFAREMGLEWTQKNCRLTEPMKETKMNIKVGDKVLYTGPSEWDLTHGNVYRVVNVCDDWVEVLDDAGEDYAFDPHDCEPITDATQDTPDYNNGKWHGWNGGECPVHPESVVDYVWHDPNQNTAGLGSGRQAVEKSSPRLAWGNVVKFRVTNPYVGPKKPREWWIDVDWQEDCIMDVPVDGFVHVREVLDD